MGHWISELVGRRDWLAGIAVARALRAPAELAQGFGFLPLDDENLEALLRLPLDQLHVDHGDADFEDGEAFNYLTPALLGWCCSQSRGCRFAYVETQYFGGTGGQGAAIFEDGTLDWGPFIGDEPEPKAIGQALRLLGAAQTPGAQDLFDSVGLGRHRSNDAWREYPLLTDKPAWMR